MGGRIVAGEEFRIVNHPILGALIPGRKVKFIFEGKQLEGFEGEPLAAALLTTGIRLLRRTSIHGEPRGVFCAIGLCTDCMVTVDGVPNIRACVTPLREGMTITMQGRRQGFDD